MAHLNPANISDSAKPVGTKGSHKILAKDSDRAFNELASFLYEKYRKLKQEEQIRETIDNFGQDNTCDIL